MTDLHPFDDATHLTQLGDGIYQGRTTPRYANMAGPYGGITAACLMRAVLIDPRLAGTPVSITVNLCAAVADGTFEMKVTQIRSGKYIQHWAVELTQGDRICTTASVITAVRGESFAHHPEMLPEVPPPGEVPISQATQRLPWLKAYDFRFVSGTPDFLARDTDAPLPARSIQYVADNPARPLDYAALTAIADSFLLRIFKVRPQYAPMGSVTITTHFIASPEEVAAQGSEPVLAIVDAARFNSNFHDQTMQIWGKDGTLLATGNQLVWFKA